MTLDVARDDLVAAPEIVVRDEPPEVAARAAGGDRVIALEGGTFLLGDVVHVSRRDALAFCAWAGTRLVEVVRGVDDQDRGEQGQHERAGLERAEERERGERADRRAGHVDRAPADAIRPRAVERLADEAERGRDQYGVQQRALRDRGGPCRRRAAKTVGMEQ
jgi:hypothetical protein